MLKRLSGPAPAAPCGAVCAAVRGLELAAAQPSGRRQGAVAGPSAFEKLPGTTPAALQEARGTAASAGGGRAQLRTVRIAGPPLRGNPSPSSPSRPFLLSVTERTRAGTCAAGQRRGFSTGGVHQRPSCSGETRFDRHAVTYEPPRLRRAPPSGGTAGSCRLPPLAG